MSEELVTLPRKRLEELVAIEQAYEQERSEPERPSVAEWFNRFRAKVAAADKERRG